MFHRSISFVQLIKEETKTMEKDNLENGAPKQFGGHQKDNGESGGTRIRKLNPSEGVDLRINQEQRQARGEGDIEGMASALPVGESMDLPIPPCSRAGEPPSVCLAAQPLLPMAAVNIPRAGLLRKKSEEKFRRRDLRSWDNVMKKCENVPDKLKFEFLGKQYLDLYNEYRKLTVRHQTVERQQQSLQKEYNNKVTENSKNLMAKNRLETLCRELQRQNKMIKEESMAKSKEDEEYRKDVSSKLTNKLADINAMMDENKEKSNRLREENEKMTEKLTELYSQFQKREEDIERVTRQLELERKCSQANLKKMDLEMQAQQQIHAQEQKNLKLQLEKTEEQVRVLTETVTGLQVHIDLYKNQYEGFELTMSKSTAVFDTFKAEIKSMTQKMNVLQDECNIWKQKFNDCMKALLDISEIKKNLETFCETLDRKNNRLQTLCRQLHCERTAYLQLLKDYGIEPSLPREQVQEVADTSTRETESPQRSQKRKGAGTSTRQTESPQMAHKENGAGTSTRQTESSQRIQKGKGTGTSTKQTESPQMTHKEKKLQLMKENLKRLSDNLSEAQAANAVAEQKASQGLDAAKRDKEATSANGRVPEDDGVKGASEEDKPSPAEEDSKDHLPIAVEAPPVSDTTSGQEKDASEEDQNSAAGNGSVDDLLSELEASPASKITSGQEKGPDNGIDFQPETESKNE